MPSSIAQEDILMSLEALAEERRRHIDETRDRRAAEEDRHVSELRQITISHRNANRVLVQAIEAAHKRGIPKKTIYDRVGITTQRFGQMKRAIREWNSEEGRS